MKQLLVRGLRKSFPVKYDWLGRPSRFVDAIADVDLEINGGETLALVGESGSGKSTVARLILQLIRPDAGSVEFDGEQLISLRGEEMRRMRRRLQIIFQDPYSSLDPSLSIRDILSEPFRVHHQESAAPKQLEKLLEDVGLPGSFLTRMPHELSGGQRQRVAIARALAVEPEFIACDEIVSALDVSTRAQILNLLSALQAARGVSMLFITHDLAIVPFIARRVAVIYLGRIVEQGTVDEVFSRPQHAYTKALLAAVPVPDPAARVRESPEG
jgi:ABC-type glutathione transport system ATPase component